MTQFPFHTEPLLINGGRIETVEDDIFRLGLPADSQKYCDAQIDDYHLLPRKHFPWSPPCRMEIFARASHPTPPGTLGFGFWNDPFTISIGQGGAAKRLPAPPQTIWFFYGSPENDILFDPGLPGHGWKASCIRSPNIPSILLTPPAAIAIALSYIPLFRAGIMRTANRIVKADEAILKVPLDEWHTYSIEWKIEKASFYVDGREVLNVDHPPTGPLGFVAWIDNQYATASPKRGFRFGVIPTIENQWLELEVKCLIGQ
jgi:hypothetical protein